MAKYEATPIGQGFGSQSRINENFENIEENFQRVLYRDGSAPNHMLADLDMNSQRIINLPSATSASEPATYAQLLAAQIGGDTPFVATFKETQTATAGQQVITLTLVPYIPGSNNLSLYINGVRMAGDAYTETDPNTITLSEALDAGDKIEAVINERTVESAFSFTGIAKEIFTATAGQTVFNITGVVYNPGSGNLSVYVDGVRQAGTAYSEDTPSSFSFLSPLAGGETVEIIVNERPVSADTVPASSVTATIDSVNTNVLDNLKKNQPITNVAALKALTGMVDGAIRQTLGYYTAGDGGHSLYRFNAASSATANDGTIIQPNSGGGRWELVHYGIVRVEQFGVAGLSADSTRFAEAIAACAGRAFELHGTPGSTYTLNKIDADSCIKISSLTGVVLKGNGAVLYLNDAQNCHILKAIGSSVDPEACADIEISGWICDANMANQTDNASNQDILRITNCSRVKVFGNVLKNTNSNGVVTDGSSDCEIYKNRVYSIGRNGIICGASSTVSPQNNKVYLNYIKDTGLNALGNGIFFTATNASTSTTTIHYRGECHSNVVINAGDIGIELGIRCYDCSMHDNIVVNSKNQPYIVRDNKRPVVYNNTGIVSTTSGGTYSGITFDTQLGIADPNAVLICDGKAWGNTFTNVAVSGIEFEDISGLQAWGNVIEGVGTGSGSALNIKGDNVQAWGNNIKNIQRGVRIAQSALSSINNVDVFKNRINTVTDAIRLESVTLNDSTLVDNNITSATNTIVQSAATLNRVRQANNRLRSSTFSNPGANMGSYINGHDGLQRAAPASQFGTISIMAPAYGAVIRVRGDTNEMALFAIDSAGPTITKLVGSARIGVVADATDYRVEVSGSNIVIKRYSASQTISSFIVEF